MNPDGTPDASGAFWSNITDFVTAGAKAYTDVKVATTSPAKNASQNTGVVGPGTGPVPVDQKTMLVYGAVALAIVAFVALRK